MKKSTKIILGVIIGVLVAYSAFMTLGVYVVSQDYNEIVDEYNGFVNTYNNMKERNEELNTENQSLKDKWYSDTRIMDAAINVISSDAIGAKAGDAYIAVIPEDAMDKVDAKQIGAALSSTDVKYCILTFKGDGVASYSIRIDK